MFNKALLWFRRDLRLIDHAALAAVSQQSKSFYCVFVFDQNILDPLKKKSCHDRRLHFICEALAEMQTVLREYGGQLLCFYGEPKDIIPQQAQRLGVDAVFWNRDYTSYSRDRDDAVKASLLADQKVVFDFQDHVLIEPDQLFTKQEKPYHVFTPYSRAWLTHLPAVKMFTDPDLSKVLNHEDACLYDFSALMDFAGFKACDDMMCRGGQQAGMAQLARFRPFLAHYDEDRNYPSLDHTSKISVYIRHGCVSIRQLYLFSQELSSRGSDVWLNELIWREFYQMIAFHYPAVKSQEFKEGYRGLAYPGSEACLQAWKDGQTGFPIVDAAMRCLNQTGWMHNRLRMVVASFLCKLAMVDWRRGERYFSWKLLDYEFASNNGGWQWAAGCGCDAAPYFRIFNPETQSRNFDQEGEFIKQYCPELAKFTRKDIHNPPALLRGDYPMPILDYKAKRAECLVFFKEGISK